MAGITSGDIAISKGGKGPIKIIGGGKKKGKNKGK